jgi:hypothetical protein
MRVGPMKGMRHPSSGAKGNRTNPTYASAMNCPVCQSEELSEEADFASSEGHAFKR